MPDKKISELDDGVAGQAGDEVPVERSGDNFRVPFEPLIVPITLGTKGTNTVGDAQDFCVIPAFMDGLVVYDAVAATGVAGEGTGDVLSLQVTNSRAGLIFSTELTVDAGELTSTSAATPFVINEGNDDLATGDILYFDITAVHGTPGEDAQIILLCKRAGA